MTDGLFVPENTIVGRLTGEDASALTPEEVVAMLDLEDVGAVDSVNGQTGVVVLDAADVGADASGSAAAVAAAAVNDGDAAGGDLAGTYPNPSVVDDSHNHTTASISGLVAADVGDFATAVGLLVPDLEPYLGTPDPNVLPYWNAGTGTFRDPAGSALGDGGWWQVDYSGGTLAVLYSAEDLTSSTAALTYIYHQPGLGFIAISEANGTGETEIRSQPNDATLGTRLTQRPTAGQTGPLILLEDGSHVALFRIEVDGTVTMSSKKIAGLANGTLSTDAANLGQVDAKVSDTAYDATSWNGVTGIAPSKNAVRDQIETLAPLASPALTGNPTAPTQSAGNNSTRIATTAYADAAAAATVSDTAYNATSWDAVTGIAPSKNAVRDQMELKANLASPALTGTPTAPTASASDNSTKIATTAYADGAASTAASAKVSDTAYAGSWDAVTTVAPSKNAVYDKINSLAKADVGLGNVDNTSDATKNSATATLTNKRVTPRVGTATSSATPTINTDNVDQFNITALATAITSMTTNLSGTPTDGQKLMLRITGDATPRSITWGASFASSGVATLLATTAASKTHHVGLIWDSTLTKWVCLAVDATGY